MLVGIIIGIMVWQIVVGIAQDTDCAYDWWVAPIYWLGYWLVERVIWFFQALGNYKAYLYLFSIGKNPFRMKVSDLQNLTLEQKEELVKRSIGRYKNAMKKLIEMYH